MIKNIMIVGVGGQGSLLASRIVGNAAMALGYDVKVSEVHGMSQRGGSVVTYVRYGDKVHSPVIGQGEADIILSFEQLEAARWLSYLKKDGVLITSTQKVMPMPVITGAVGYPDEIISKIEGKNIKVVAVDALKKAEEAGSIKAVNVVLIGLMAHYSDFTKEQLLEALEKSVPQKLLDVNLKAFESGYNCI
ncbi:MAG: indolepyruvate oxidoreductase subunit beta [Ruminococcaceae bacterium]|nr:indolepyruvate oxidoreductase subunit beta [Oscillospiraceae bacterium]